MCSIELGIAFTMAGCSSFYLAFAPTKSGYFQALSELLLTISNAIILISFVINNIRWRKVVEIVFQKPNSTNRSNQKSNN